VAYISAAESTGVSLTTFYVIRPESYQFGEITRRVNFLSRLRCHGKIMSEGKRRGRGERERERERGNDLHPQADEMACSVIWTALEDGN